jgi:hypothetical protein
MSPSRWEPTALDFEYVPNTGCWEVISHVPTDRGYVQIRLGAQGKVAAHRASYESFYGEIPEDLFVCHYCDNRKCINPEHLFLGSAKENMKDCYAKKRGVSGARNGRAVLIESMVREIQNSSLSVKELAKLYGVSASPIYKIKQGRSWGHLE